MRISLHIRISINFKHMVSFSVRNKDFLFVTPYVYFVLEQILILKKPSSQAYNFFLVIPCFEYLEELSDENTVLFDTGHSIWFRNNTAIYSQSVYITVTCPL